MTESYPFEFDAFIRKERPDLRINPRRLTLFLMGLIILQLILSRIIGSEIWSYLPPMYLFIGFVTSIVWAFLEKERKHLKYFTTAKLTEDQVLIKHLNFSWSEVTKVSSGPVENEDIYDWIVLISARHASGLDAFIEFNHNSKYHFLLRTTKDQLAFESILKDQGRRNNISLNILQDGLGLEYEEIQKIKKTAYNNK